MEAAYRSNVYHNATHAADVVQSLGALLVPDGLAGQLTDLEMLSMILGAAVHDVGHPGERVVPAAVPPARLVRRCSLRAAQSGFLFCKHGLWCPLRSCCSP